MSDVVRHEELTLPIKFATKFFHDIESEMVKMSNDFGNDQVFLSSFTLLRVQQRVKTVEWNGINYYHAKQAS